MKSFLFTLVIFLAIAAKKWSKKEEAAPAEIYPDQFIPLATKWNPPAEAFAFFHEKDADKDTLIHHVLAPDKNNFASGNRIPSILMCQ